MDLKNWKIFHFRIHLQIACDRLSQKKKEKAKTIWNILRVSALFILAIPDIFQNLLFFFKHNSLPFTFILVLLYA